MIEFGSDFHYIECGSSEPCRTIHDYFPDARYYADGRQSLAALYRIQGWKRLWVPEYYCYEVYRSLEDYGLNLVPYHDVPGGDDRTAVDSIPFGVGDAVLRVDYYGLRSFRSNRDIPVPVVEDHSHDLLGDWSLQSDADWCIASLRKSLPVAEGGILWSPQGYGLPSVPSQNAENELAARRRWQAMKVKAAYLHGDAVEKQVFRNVMLETEGFFDMAPISSIDSYTKEYLESFDVSGWYLRKRLNMLGMGAVTYREFQALLPEDAGCNAFSYIILCDTQGYRDRLRGLLIHNNVYPAVLWSIPGEASPEAKDFSSRMLSIHCDGRYSPDEIKQMISIIESVV